MSALASLMTWAVVRRAVSEKFAGLEIDAAIPIVCATGCHTHDRVYAAPPEQLPPVFADLNEVFDLVVKGCDAPLIGRAVRLLRQHSA